ncbi:MAG: MarC family protein [bacterium]|nr:MarC family protein [bacterium]
MLKFWLSFVPLFIAVDAIGILPMFINLTEGLSRKKRDRVILQSIITAMLVALLFLAIGKVLLRLLGITVADFMIAGGLLLFLLSINDMLSMEKKQRSIDPDSLGAVPIGVPLIVGPAVLAATILLESQYGWLPTVVALIINISLAGLIFYYSHTINRFLGRSGAKTLSKLASLLLASIGIMIIRKGIMIFLKTGDSSII